MRNIAIQFLFVFIFLAMGCQNQDSSAELNQLTADEKARVQAKELATIRKDILGTADLNILLKEYGYEFYPDLINPDNRIGNYVSAKERALAMGVYGSDLNYLAIFEQTALAPSYVLAIMKLADELGISDVFDQELLLDLVNDVKKENFRNQSKKINEALRNAEEKLNTEERSQLTALIVAGGWIEGIYISTSIALTQWPHSHIATEMWMQCFSYDKVISLLSLHQDNQGCKDMLRLLLPLKGKINIITTGTAETLKVELEDFHSQIDEIRNIMVKP